MSHGPCDACEELLQGYLDPAYGRRGPQAESHLDTCDYCRRRYRFEASLRQYVQTTAAERMPAGLMERLTQLAHAARRCQPRLTAAARAGRPGCPRPPATRGRRRERGVPRARAARRPESCPTPRVRRAADGPARRRTRPRREARRRLRQACDHTLDGLRREVGAVGEDDDRGLDVRRRALRARSRATLPAPASTRHRSRPAAGVSSVCAPGNDDDLVDRSSARSRSSTSGSRRRCFGVPKRDASPAASTTAAMLTVPRPSPTRSRRDGSAAPWPGRRARRCARRRRSRS